MTSEELRQDIRINENLIAQKNAEIARLNKQLEELEQLKAKIDRVDNNFASKQRKRAVGIDRLTGAGLNIKMASAYANGMRNLILGGEAIRVAGNISAARERVKQEIRKILDQIEMQRADIRYLQHQNNNLYYQLSNSEET